MAGCAGLPSGPVEAALRGPGDECPRPLHIGSDPVPGCREGLSLGKGSVASTQWPVRVKGVRRRSPESSGQADLTSATLRLPLFRDTAITTTCSRFAANAVRPDTTGTVCSARRTLRLLVVGFGSPNRASCNSDFLVTSATAARTELKQAPFLPRGIAPLPERRTVLRGNSTSTQTSRGLSRGE